jgi:ligand-binding sensor domain-containing protein
MKSKILAAIFWLLLSGLLHSQSFSFTQYTVSDGLPQSQVYALLQDSRGYLWVGTQGGGLARFDGIRFRNFSSKDGLQGNYVNALMEDGFGNIWIGTNRGLNRFDGRRFNFIELQKGRDVDVNALCERKSAAGTELFIASQNGVYSFPIPADGKTGHQGWVAPHFFEKINGNPFGRLTAAFCDSKNQVWVGGDDGLFKLENTEWKTIQRRKAEVLAITETKDGRILAGIFNSGILILDGKKRNFLNVHNGLPTNKIQCLWRNDRDGKIWVGTQDKGACIWSPNTGSVVQMTEAQGLCSQNIRAILGDEWGKVIWFGSSGGGICKYATKYFEHFDESDGLPSNFVYAICAGKNGQGRWFAAGDQGIAYWGPWGDTIESPDTLLHFDASNGFYNVKCRAIFRDRADRIWVGTEGLGLAVFTLPSLRADSAGMPVEPGGFRFFTKKNGLAGNWIRDIAEDAAGNLWIATTDGGISRLKIVGANPDNPVFKTFSLAEGLPSESIHALHFDKTGRLWFASQSGEIGILDKEKISLLGTTNGLPGSPVRSLAEDKYGMLWAGTAGRGVGFLDIYFDKTLHFRQLDALDSLASPNVYLLQTDSKGQLWVGTERGVDRILTDSSGRFLRVKHFGLAEGFRGIETCQNASLLGPEGDIWFGTMNGLTHYLPPSDSIHGSAPKPILTGVRLFYEPLETSVMAKWSGNWGGLVDGAVFPYNQNHLGFEFFATDFSNQERVMYAWQLAGQETGWSPFSNRTEVSYANLPPGDYHFRLRARNEDGITSQPMEVYFKILPPYWATWWFRLAALGGLSLLVFGLFRWRIRQEKQKAAAEREQLELQNRLLTLEQKSRQLQMNPHFIFNALNSIQSLVSAGKMDQARQYILKFGRLMRAVLDNSRQPLIPLEKEVETLRQYLEMEQFCREGKFDFELDTSGVESADLHIPPMLLQPFVENAILHGIGPLSGKKGMVRLHFTEKENLLEVVIADNGIGIEQSQARKAGQDTESRQSVGIAVTRERLELIKQSAGFAENAVDMRQLVGPDGEVEGTAVVVRMAV